jgi:hypothetical protein
MRYCDYLCQTGKDVFLRVLLHRTVSSPLFVSMLVPEIGWNISTLGYVAFFVTICYHTIYAPPLIYPPLAFYGLDMLLRFFRYRIKDATLTPISNQITMVCKHFYVFTCVVSDIVAGEYTLLYRRLDGRSTCSAPCFLWRANLWIPPTHDYNRTSFNIVPFQGIRARNNPWSPRDWELVSRP